MCVVSKKETTKKIKKLKKIVVSKKETTKKIVTDYTSC